MILLHTAPLAIELHNLKNVLELEGIRCEIRGELRAAGVGELPVNECWAELWLLDASQEAKAREILAAPEATPQEAWKCPGCGESVEGQFGQCWNCQHPAPEREG